MLVEHGVRRQLLLAIHVVDPTVAAHHCGVVEPAVLGPLGHTNHGGARPGRLGDPFDLSPAVVDEPPLEDEVLRRVATHRELTEHSDPRTACLGLGEGLEDRVRVRNEIADGRIQLGQGDTHGTHGPKPGTGREDDRTRTWTRNEGPEGPSFAVPVGPGRRVALG